MHVIHTALSKHSHNKHRIIHAALRNALTHSTFMRAAFLICSHIKASTRKATNRSAYLSLVRAAQHINGQLAKRGAARVALHKLMNLSISTHNERPTCPFPHNPASPVVGAGNLWPVLANAQQKN